MAHAIALFVAPTLLKPLLSFAKFIKLNIAHNANTYKQFFKKYH